VRHARHSLVGPETLTAATYRSHAAKHDSLAPTALRRRVRTSCLGLTKAHYGSLLIPLQSHYFVQTGDPPSYRAHGGAGSDGEWCGVFLGVTDLDTTMSSMGCDMSIRPGQQRWGQGRCTSKICGPSYWTVH